MKTIALQTGDGRRIAREVRIADTFAARSVGLLRDDMLEQEQGLLLIPGGSVHTLGMRFPIDIVFLDRHMRVLNFAPRVPPGRLRLAPPGTRRVLELASGRVAAVGLLIGMHLMAEHEERLDEQYAGAGRIRSRPSPPPGCTRPPFQFSLRLPPQHRGTVHSNLGCSIDRGARPATPMQAAES